MSPASRRIFLYWVLLLVPTLVVGGWAVWLLRREETRLAERGAYADEARRAAVAARARLIVENVELFVGDVQTGLLDTLAAEPADTLDAFLEDWEKSNPLVRVAYHARPDGTLLRPNPRTSGEEARGFLRRFSRVLAEQTQTPWSAGSLQKKVQEDKREQLKLADEALNRQDISANIAQFQNARREVQDLVKPQQNYSPGAGASADYAPRDRAAESRARAAESDRLAAAAAPPAPAAQGERRAGPSSSGASSRVARNEPAAAARAPAPQMRAKDAQPDRRGWLPVVVERRLHLIGWLQPGGVGDIRGVELELAALIGRLGSSLPAEPGLGEGYALRDDQGRILHQAGAVPKSGEPMLRVGLDASLLPGWEVVAFLAPAAERMGNGAGFFGVSVLLVALFVAAILMGGSLLLWQARRSEEEAAQKTSFVANVSHEFKTPLTTIRLYSELLEQGRVRDVAQGSDYLRTIGRETQRLARLVNNALDFSRLEQGRKKYALEPVDLGAELRRLLDTHAPRVAEAGLELRRSWPDSPLRISTDRDAVEQIVLNVIDNACKYAASGGEIVVTAAPRATGGAEVRIADRGPGVPPEHRERIFEKFHRVDDALTSEKGGAGLGLSIARQLARGLGGELRHAPREGGGSEFVLELP